MTDNEVAEMILEYSRRKSMAMQKLYDFWSNENVIEYGIDFGNFNGEPIRWLVMEYDLNEKGDFITLISREPICEMPYHDQGEVIPVTWGECSLREWLNGEFYQTAFSEQEKEHINYNMTTQNDNTEGFALLKGGAQNKCAGEGEAHLRDRVSLLYIKNFGSLLNCFYDDGSAWWLRDPGRDNYHAACVFNGKKVPEGKTTFSPLGVRPVITLKF